VSSNTIIAKSDQASLSPSAAAVPLEGLAAAGCLLAAACFGPEPPPPLPIKPEMDCSVLLSTIPKFELAESTFIPSGVYAASALHATPRRRRRQNSGRFFVVFDFRSFRCKDIFFLLSACEEKKIYQILQVGIKLVFL
jgi:hypothetical protein